MAYSIDGLYPDQRGNGYRVHTYTSTDVEAVVAASGYFDDGSTTNTGIRNILNVGDKIECFDSTSTLNYALRVAAITSGVIATDVLGPGRTEVVTTTNVILAAETGTHFVLNSVTAFVSTLPVPKLGLEFWFHIGATGPTTTHTVVTNASANIIHGSISSPEVSALVACVVVADTISFVANLAEHGDYAHVWSDGTGWYLDGMTFVQDGMTTTST